MSYKPFTIEVKLPTDNGFIGRKCQDDECGKYFKISIEFDEEHMYCPYCAVSIDPSSSITTQQSDYLSEVAEHESQKYAENLFDDILTRTFKNSPDITYTKIPTLSKHVVPKYVEEKVDSEITCPDCSLQFQVYGIFGYCPGCKAENIIIYDANVQIILQEINNSDNPKRQLRHAYNDLVSAFETFCKKYARQLGANARGRFQGIYDARKYFKRHHSIDLLENISTNDNLILRRTFAKRHVYMHNSGIVSGEYVAKVPEDRNLLGQEAKLSKEEFLETARCIRRVLEKLI